MRIKSLRRRGTFIYFLFVVIIFVLAGCGFAGGKQQKAADANKLQVVASFAAMQSMAEIVGKDHVEVHAVIPNGTEPHDFTPTTKDLAALRQARVFVYSGMGMESGWLDKTLAVADDRKDMITVDASKGIEPINLPEKTNNGKTVADPHIWLSISGASAQAENIKNAFVEADPANKADYEKNCQEFQNELEQLKKEYTAKIAGSKHNYFVTGHAAFSYLARDFDLTQKSISDALISGEPSAKNLKELTDYCKENKVSTIFVEDMVSPKVSETLANEVNAKAVPIYTLENVPEGMDYIAVLKYDLDKIYESLN